MTYSAIYCALISKRLRNPITKDDCYVERHHIIPKSEGGSDESYNLVNLTAREHYVAHLLLAKIYKDRSMWCAVQMMVNGGRGLRRFKFNSRLYEQARKRRNETISLSMSGENNPNFGKHLPKDTRRKIAKATTGRRNHFFGKHHTEETRKRISNLNSGSNNPNFGKHRADATRKRIASSMKGNTNCLGQHWYNNGT